MTTMNRKTIPFLYKLTAGFILLLIMFAAAMVFGAADTTLQDVWQALTGQGEGGKLSLIREIRLPREIAAMFVGAALAVSGAIMQGMTRNPLADPGLLGLTAGANAGLAVTLALLPSANYFYVMIACFIGAAAGALMVFGIGALRRGGFSPLRIVLAGAAVSAFLYAIAEGIGIYFKISKDVSMWTAGGAIGTSWSQLHHRSFDCGGHRHFAASLQTIDRFKLERGSRRRAGAENSRDQNRSVPGHHSARRRFRRFGREFDLHRVNDSPYRSRRGRQRLPFCLADVRRYGSFVHAARRYARTHRQRAL
ncbi:Vitamin B12 import system permease protein BtuC [Paenibacillus sp. CECT 9249]|nr:Vitamin B12 import system permease protein BtuC [Paenibacillus sp. CECT 9249]